MAFIVLPDAFAAQPALRPEQVTFGAYTFVPHYRTGIAAALTNPFTGTGPIRAEVAVSIPVGGGDPARTTLRVRGPGDVLGLDTRQIIRRFPAPGTGNAEPNDLAHVEFDSPDLPWQFTPAKPDNNGHLPPWLRLVVVNAAVASITAATGTVPAILSTPQTELPPPDDAWAWAHAQVLGKKAGPPSLAQRLGPATPTANLSRLLAPRRLTPHTSWIACVVPTFKAGAEAAVQGAPTTQQLAWAWGSDGMIDLPVYDYWTFSTGADGDFESLARRLLPQPPGETVGVRLVGTGHPGNGIPALASGEGLRHVRGALTRPGNRDPEPGWPPATTDLLQAQLHAVDDQHFDPAAGPDPTIGPPLYAGAHAARPRVDDAAPAWFRDVNLDPADRIVAGLGTRVSRMDQEQLIAGAWTQVEGVLNTNRALRAAQFGRYVGTSLHTRHIAALTAADLLAVTDRVTGELLEQPGQTVRAALDASVLPLAATSGVARRLTAPRGRYTRFVAGSSQESAAAARVRAVRGLLAGDDGNTRSWVHRYDDPAGVTSVSGLTIDFVSDPEDLDELLRAPGAVQLLDDQDAVAAAVGQPADQFATYLARLFDLLLSQLPTPADIDANEAAAEGVEDMVGRIFAVFRAAVAHGLSPVPIRRDTADLLGIDGGGSDPVFIDEDTLRNALQEIIFDAVRAGYFNRGGEIPEVPLDTGELPRGTEPGEVVVDIIELGKPFVRPGGPADPRRDPVAVIGLGVVGKLAPSMVVTNRVLGRLPKRTAWPVWLPPNWFDDHRIDPVLAAPKFTHPMYEALDRYDRDWLMPGVTAMTPHEMVTMLSTNARFVEAFLIGLNTEFAGELVWRGYPTDGRATSFFSFWRPKDELLAPLNAFADGALGSHLDPDIEGALVFVVRGELVRRYPQLLAQLVQQDAPGILPSRFSVSDPSKELFRLHLDPDMLLVGFSVRADEVTAVAEGTHGAWWLTLSEHVGQPRFGLDEPPDAGPTPSPQNRDDLQWGHLKQRGDFLTGEPPNLALQPPFRSDAAYFGWLLFQQPARAAFSAHEMFNPALRDGGLHA